MVTISQAGNKDMARAVKKRVVLVMARQAPGDTPASYIVQGRLII